MQLKATILWRKTTADKQINVFYCRFKRNFKEIFKRNCTISTGIPNLGMWCKKWSCWISGVGVGDGQKIRLRLNRTTSGSS